MLPRFRRSLGRPTEPFAVLLIHLAVAASALVLAQAPGQPAPNGKAGPQGQPPRRSQIQPMPADVEPVVTTATGLKYCVLT